MAVGEGEGEEGSVTGREGLGKELNSLIGAGEGWKMEGTEMEKSDLLPRSKPFVMGCRIIGIRTGRCRRRRRLGGLLLRI